MNKKESRTKEKSIFGEIRDGRINWAWFLRLIGDVKRETREKSVNGRFRSGWIM